MKSRYGSIGSENHSRAIVKPQQDSVVELRLSTTVAAARVIRLSGFKKRDITVEIKAMAAIPVDTSACDAVTLKVELVALLKSEFGAINAKARAHGAKITDTAAERMAFIKKPRVLIPSQRGFSTSLVANVANSSIARIGLK